ncbi:ABC transporter ATP-binding protein [Thalassobaculum fulvum]|uniref:ABC transporter ATP-binding protein n=1 Tax=Thalassobaculum fulvum TaxID=1633335 RepID=A0A918XT97_9PROT|nr:ABC transporter ATP-binding protein [Thalassobaculum fulvum]GHD53130.1 ABC transporter ATP-binding protein [Thalassobaculum fulvum]
MPVRRIVEWFEHRIDPLRPAGDPHPLTPPTSTWRILFGLVREIGWPLGLLVAASAAVSAVEVAIPWSIGRVVDLVAGDPANVANPWREVGVLVVLLVLVRPAITVLASLLRNQTIARNVSSLVRWRFHEYVAGHDVGFFQNDFVGRIASRVVQTGRSIRTLLRVLTDQLLYAVLFLAGTVIFLVYRSPLFALPVLCWIVLYALSLRLYLPRNRRAARRVAEAASVFTGRIVDGYSNYLTVRLFSGHAREDAHVRRSLEQAVERMGEQARYTTVQISWLSLLNGALIASGGIVGVLLWQAGRVSAGDVAAAMALLLQIHTLSRIAMFNLGDLFDAVGTLEDSVQALSKPQTVLDRPGAQPLAVTRGEIAFEAVRFDYGRERGAGQDGDGQDGDGQDGAGPAALNGVDLVVRPGERIGLVGPSGAGKSSLMMVLLRLYDLRSGRILIDGQDIAAVTQDSLRDAVAVVTQDPSLMHRSIRDNIGYGRPDATAAEIVAAARMARADDFITGLVDARGRRGYDAFVGERGVKLSGGQRQRLAVARALLKDAPILVLDEATSSLDSEAEAAIQESLKTLMAGKTVIVIAHRLSTIARMDRLVVMDRGRVVETGTHAELVARGGLYARLWERQSDGFLDLDALREDAAD